jgi:hypothetical protein
VAARVLRPERDATARTVCRAEIHQDGEHNSNFIVGWTHTFSPTLLVDANGSYFHLPIYRTPQNYAHGLLVASFLGLGPQLIEGAPQITITNITNVGDGIRLKGFGADCTDPYGRNEGVSRSTR